MNRPSDYELELARMDQSILELEGHSSDGALDHERARRLVYWRYRRASLAGDLVRLAEVEDAIERALQQGGAWPDLCLLKANLDFTLHRLSAVRCDLEMAPGLADSPDGRAMLADLDLQEGRYQEARRGYERVIRDNPSWNNLARLAYLEARLGNVEDADRLYLEAEDEITAKEMRSYAWVELQRGLLDLTHGRYEEAWQHYRRADDAYSGYWLVDEHVAELLGAEGKLAEAAGLFIEVVARVPKPELHQAIGELYGLMGKPEEAELWYEKALAAYLASARRGDVHYFHHLADFYADVRQDGAEAVRWAGKDCELRPNPATQAALAWALYRVGDFEAALEPMRLALSSGVRDARLFSQAGMVYLAAGRTTEGSHYLAAAAKINPHHQDFHVHHY